jgi:hypothetical protein
MDMKKVEAAEVRLKSRTGKLEPDHVADKPGEFAAELEYIVRRPDGSIRERQVRKSESFVRGFFDLLLVQMLGVGEVIPAEVRDTGNTIRLISISSQNFACNAPANNDAYGIVVGTGTNAPAVSDYALQTKIANGSGAGQLQYGGVAFGLPTSDSTTSHFTVTRDFSNVSGATITVYETGLYVLGDLPEPWQSTRQSISVQYPIMTIRDVIGGGINILNGETLTINYRLRCVV